MKEIRKGICPFCRLGCELGVVSEGWNVTGVEYSGEGSPNDGSLCARGNAAAVYLDHPRRLVYPIRNRKEINWGEAFGELTDIVKKTDPEELAITYDSNLTEEEYSLIWGLAEKLGVESLASSYLEPEHYFAHVLNGLPRASLEDVRSSSVFLLIGDVFNQTPVIARHILEAKYASKKGRIYAVDSYVTHTGSFADLLVQVKPGTESLVLLALSSLVAKGREEFPAKDYMKSSGAQVGDVEEIARALKGNEKKAVVAVTAYGRTHDPLLLSGAAQHLVTQLPGDKAFLPVGESFSKGGKVGFADVLRKIESGKIKVLINFGEVFPHLYPQLGEKLRGLSSLVSTAVLKDYVGDIPGLWLPTALNLEKSGQIGTAFGLRSNEPVVAPASGAKSTGEIVEELARELSLKIDGRKAIAPQEVIEPDTLKERADRLARNETKGIVLVGEKLAYDFHSFFTEESCVKLNPSDAVKLDVQNGDLLGLKTSQAQTKAKAVTTDRVPPGMAVVSTESPGMRELFEPSIDEGVLCFKPQTVELWQEKAQT